jgi:glycosyltransferase involved in cell wall biosynthesis
VSVSEAVDHNVAWLPARRRAVIPNPIACPPADAADASAPPHMDAHGEFLVSMGRLSHAKGFDVLIQAFALVAPDFPHWKLLIIGDGELRDALEAQTAALGLKERILFCGALLQPFALLRRAQLFVMASRYEGFPLAHGEALACGLPVIASDCPSAPARGGGSPRPGGVRELIRRATDGILTPCEDPAALARAMATLMREPAVRRQFARNAPAAAARFAPSRVVDAWEDLLGQIRRREPPDTARR